MIKKESENMGIVYPYLVVTYPFIVLKTKKEVSRVEEIFFQRIVCFLICCAECM